MARPTKTLAQEQKVEVETLAALLSQDQIADYFGICRNTFRAICERDPEVDERYKRGKAKAIGHVANGLLQRARAGDNTAAIFYLKTQAGWRETNTLEHAVTPSRDPDEAFQRFVGMLNRSPGEQGRLIEHEPRRAVEISDDELASMITRPEV